MTTYNQLAGYRVNYLSSDPTLNSGNEGQVWYNSTTGTFKALVQIAAWSSSGNLPAVRSGSGGAGIQTAALGFGGATPTITGATEQYDGTSWVSAASMGTARTGLGGCGTVAASLGFSGNTGPGNVTTTEEFTGETSANNVKTITTS